MVRSVGTVYPNSCPIEAECRRSVRRAVLLEGAQVIAIWVSQ